MTGEEKELFARIEDLKNTSERTGKPMFTGFLTPVQQSFIKNNHEIKRGYDITFDGGCEGAERAVAAVAPRGYGSDRAVFPITILSVNYKGDKLSHRDILGALMGLGIKRDKIGDIIDNTDPQMVICDSKIADYIIQNFTKAGRSNVRCNISDIIPCVLETPEIITATVASLRLDSVIAEGFSLSRTKAAEAIRRGIVYVNWTLAASASKEVKLGDNITLRGMGKIKLEEISGLSRKGRTFIKISKYTK